MSMNEADHAAAVIQRRARGHKRRHRYARQLERLMMIEMEAEHGERYRVQQWCNVLPVQNHDSLRPELRPVLNKFAISHRNKTGDRLYYNYSAHLSNVAEVVGRELRRCRRLNGIPGLIHVRDEVVQIKDEIVVTIEAHVNDKPLLEHIVGLDPDRYNGFYVRTIIASVVQIVGSMHDRDIVCGHLMPSKLYHDGTSLKLMPFGLGKYMPISDQHYFIPDLECFIAPDIVHNHGAYRPWSDVYSIGALMYLLMTGTYFTGDDLAAAPLSDDARDLMSLLLDRRQFYRLKISEILQHRWFSNDGSDNKNNWGEIQSNISQLVNERALYDRVLRRFANSENRRLLTLRFCRLLDYDACPGFGRLSSDLPEVNEALKHAIEKLSSLYLSQDEPERSHINPLEVLAGIVKGIASDQKPSQIQTRARSSKLDLHFAKSQEGGAMSPEDRIGAQVETKVQSDGQPSKITNEPTEGSSSDQQQQLAQPNS